MYLIALMAPLFRLKNELRNMVKVPSTSRKKFIAKNDTVSALLPLQIVAKNDHCVPGFALKKIIAFFASWKGVKPNSLTVGGGARKSWGQGQTIWV